MTDSLSFFSPLCCFLNSVWNSVFILLRNNISGNLWVLKVLAQLGNSGFFNLEHKLWKVYCERVLSWFLLCKHSSYRPIKCKFKYNNFAIITFCRQVNIVINHLIAYLLNHSLSVVYSPRMLSLMEVSHFSLSLHQTRNIVSWVDVINQIHYKEREEIIVFENRKINILVSTVYYLWRHFDVHQKENIASSKI